MDFGQLRKTEFSRLDRLNEIYLDYTGSGLYSKWQIDEHYHLLENSVMGNPHTFSPSSIASTEQIEKARGKILHFFNADHDEYDVIFTQNASQALKLVGESFPFSNSSRFVLTSDNHNSVNGIREYAMRKRAYVTYVPVGQIPGRESLSEYLARVDPASPDLFAYPAQSNFSGELYPLEWINIAHSFGYQVILDAAAFVPTSVLDLGKFKPDFVPVSFYKMFGYPTGVGALIARKESLKKLKRPWFSGGTVDLVTTLNKSHHLLEGPRGFEDGTLNFLDISAVSSGIEFLERIGMESIHDHVMELSRYLVRQLQELKHSNGSPMALMYMPIDPERHGSASAFNILTPEGNVVDARITGKIARENNVSVRTGCFCNPGAGEHYFGYNSEKESASIDDFLQGKIKLEDFPGCAGGSTGGAVRASLGIATIKEDIDRFISVLSGLRDCPESINDQKVETSFSC